MILFHWSNLPNGEIFEFDDDVQFKLLYYYLHIAAVVGGGVVVPPIVEKIKK